jgi:periplasmic protein TonB
MRTCSTHSDRVGGRRLALPSDPNGDGGIPFRDREGTAHEKPSNPGLAMGIAASFLLHGIAFALFVTSMISGTPGPGPHIVELTFDSMEFASTDPTAPVPVKQIVKAPESLPATRLHPDPPSHPPPIARPIDPPAGDGTPAPHSLQSDSSSDPPSFMTGETVREPDPASSAPASASSGGDSVRNASAASAVEKRSARGSSGSAARGRYADLHFAGIRDTIQRRISYPAMARKMGWEGRVTVAITVRTDGTVGDARVVNGSGFPLLDRSALDAVRAAAALPRPHVETEIVIPILYRLVE